MVEIDKKKESIIDGAIKRFTHFGINKTTMNEIADDLSVSKPSLYYYFPDKGSLVLGVIERIFADYFVALKKVYSSSVSLEINLHNFIEIKHFFFQKYYMLHLSGGSLDASLNTDAVKNYVHAMRQEELNFYTKIFHQAVEKGEIEVEDKVKVSELYMASLSGITSLCLMQGNKELFLSKKELKDIVEKQISLSKIFIKGLRN